jgi:hypothetical protein
MSGRRSHSRFVVANPWEGAVRVLRDVVVNRTDRNELLAVSHAPGIVGEGMSLDLMGGGLMMALRVRVIESRPVVVDGAVRHRIRLGFEQPTESLVGSGMMSGSEDSGAAEAL